MSTLEEILYNILTEIQKAAHHTYYTEDTGYKINADQKFEVRSIGLVKAVSLINYGDSIARISNLELDILPVTAGDQPPTVALSVFDGKYYKNDNLNIEFIGGVTNDLRIIVTTIVEELYG